MGSFWDDEKRKKIPNQNGLKSRFSDHSISSNQKQSFSSTKSHFNDLKTDGVKRGFYRLSVSVGKKNGGGSFKQGRSSAKFDYLTREGDYEKSTNDEKNHFNYLAREGDYSSRDDFVTSWAGNMPEWVENPKDFWVASDEFERENGTLYREIQISFDTDFSVDDNIQMAREFISEVIGDKHAYFVAYHAPKTLNNQSSNPHAHIMFSERVNDEIERSKEQYFKRFNRNYPERGGCRKESKYSDPKVNREWLLNTRKEWANTLNNYAKKKKINKIFDEKTLVEQGFNHQPEKRMPLSEVNKFKHSGNSKIIEGYFDNREEKLIAYKKSKETKIYLPNKGGEDMPKIGEKEALFVTDKMKSEIVHNMLVAEGNTLSFVESKTITDDKVLPNNKPKEDVSQAVRLGDAMDEIIHQVKSKTFEVSKDNFIKINRIVATDEALKVGAFRDKQTYVAGGYTPPPPNELDSHFSLMMRNFLKEENIETKASDLFLDSARNQYFFDGNKRTAQLMMNGYLISKGFSPRSIMTADIKEYNQKMHDFYFSNNKTEMYDFLGKLQALNATPSRANNVSEPVKLETNKQEEKLWRNDLIRFENEVIKSAIKKGFSSEQMEQLRYQLRAKSLELQEKQIDHKGKSIIKDNELER